MKYDFDKITARLAKILQRQTALEKAIATADSVAVMNALSRRHFRLNAIYNLTVDLSMLIRCGGEPTGEKPLGAAATALMA
jgi:hypothetical protein